MVGSNHKLENPVGIDAAIQILQDALFKNVKWEGVSMYGRAQKVPHPENRTAYTPQVFDTTKNEYTDVLRKDRNNADIFFSVNDRNTTNEGILYKVECKIVFMLNVKALYPTYQGHPDTLAQEDVINALKRSRTFETTSLGTGIRECLGEYDIENIKFTDVHPNHVFCLTGLLSYQITCK